MPPVLTQTYFFFFFPVAPVLFFPVLPLDFLASVFVAAALSEKTRSQPDTNFLLAPV
jgi:hypothetical protein